MKQKTFQFKFRDLKLTVDQIERVMGYREGESQETIFEIVTSLLKEAETLCNLKAEYRIFDKISFNDAEKTVMLNNVTFNIGKIIYGQIKKSESVALFICTAGEKLGLRSRMAMKEGNLLEGFIYDVIGSEAVEAATDLMQADLEAEFRITNCFSPGYCGWNVVEQYKLFSLMPDNYCNIRLTDSALMDPVKSVSGIIGIGDNVKRLPYTCSFCDMKECLYRRKA